MYQAHLRLKNIVGRFDPFDGESEFFNRVDERSDIAGHMVKQMN